MKSGDREGARGIIFASLVDGDEEPPCPRIVVNDTTVEKLGELLNENPRGLLLIRDELPGISGASGTVHIHNCTVSIYG